MLLRGIVEHMLLLLRAVVGARRSYRPRLDHSEGWHIARCWCLNLGVPFDSILHFLSEGCRHGFDCLLLPLSSVQNFDLVRTAG